ncbi:LacI family DNA-binding transcriptional regulator [Pseudarthrobacter sp. R1]|uniref:LacI family DNA-binding transcriptional regulator n=1 Tax=Pseudarthrobacter sp. R1 TaxID=2944934 RepID=UPI00210AA38A|nr:LacI family DNA-binding transcriptional regulator [Pseudarthrobacter sp. R1]MCQ6272460.1 LacI family DNA-binding transcriptional regulator [Pseudarthrobacter sp. R1]
MTRTSNRQMPRLQDVAELAGVSHQTVSRVVNSHPNVSKTTRQKVESAIMTLGYRRNTAARSLVTRRSQTIGVLASELSQYGPAHTLLGLEQAARNAGYFVSIAALREVTKEGILNAVSHFTDQGVDGIVALVPHLSTVDALDEMNLSVPVVTVGSPGNSSISGATVDQRQGARLAVRHLLEQGHRRIAHVSGPPDWTDSTERAAGWRDALLDAGVSDQILLEGDWSAGSGYEIGLRIAAERKISALFVGNDQMALGVLRAFAETNVRVPHDVSIVGFDDQPESGYFTPPLTTVRQDFEELGHRCVDVMLKKINTGTGATSTVVTPRMVLRASTAPPPEHSPYLDRNT